MTQPAPRERILETVTALFSKHGYRAVGIDTIIRESGIAKMTLYKHFASKDALIAAYLEQTNAGFWRWLDGITDSHRDPKAQLEAIFDGVAKLSSSPTCLGCSFTHAAAEFPEFNHPGHAIAMQHKQQVLERLTGLSRAARAGDPIGLAQDLMLVMDGAWSAARIFGGGNHGSRAGATARALIAAQMTAVQTQNA